MLVKFAPFFDWASVIAVAMAVVWLFRTKTKGRSALVMAIAFFNFAAIAQVVKFDAPVWALTVLSACLVMLLVLDFALRAAKNKDGQS